MLLTVDLSVRIAVRGGLYEAGALGGTGSLIGEEMEEGEALGKLSTGSEGLCGEATELVVGFEFVDVVVLVLAGDAVEELGEGGPRERLLIPVL